MHLPKTIAIDGPAASGKSTLGKRVADELGYLFFDTGLMYRAVTWAALQRALPIEDETAITSLAETVTIDIQAPSRSDGRNCDILADGEDITWDVRRPEVDANVSVVSAYPGVRQALTNQQRRIGQRGQIVMVGRDIGTVVLPEAELKIYLVASAEERARRRFQESQARNGQASYDEILSAMIQRDEFDSSRLVSPLRAADDAVILDTDQLDEQQVLQEVLNLIRRMSEPDRL